MQIKKVFIKDFRNIDEISLDLANGINILYGENAQGKTNFLEALYLCASGRSIRTNNDNDLIKFGLNQANVNVILEDGEKIDVNILRDKKKIIAVNNVKINKLGELFGKLFTVIFSPEDLQLVKSNPASRRKFMDTELCQISKIYYYELKQYYRVLHQRNNMLKKICDNNFSCEILDTWDEQLIHYGINIIKHREKFIKQIDTEAMKIYSHVTNEQENLNVIYKPNTTAEDFQNKLEKHRKYDILMGSTSIGIHKDDLNFEINGVSAKNFASQGQQKSVALSLKLAEINLINETTNKFPTLLLDDILSELDESRQLFLFDAIKNFQVVLTCTGIENVIKKNIHTANFLKVVGGKIFNENGA